MTIRKANRRDFLKLSAATALAATATNGCAPTSRILTKRRKAQPAEVRVTHAAVVGERFPYRVPLRFGTGVITDIEQVTTHIHLESPASGKRAEGIGQILLSELWAFPSKVVERSLREKAMRHVVEQAVSWLAAEKPAGHPFEIGWVLKKQTVELCREATKRLALAEPMPLLAGLVCISPFDAAIHDAYGKLMGRPSYDCYGSDLSPDLSAFLGPRYGNRYVSQYLRPAYAPRVPIWHLVGGLDKLRESQVSREDPRDRIPVSLEKWIERDGVYCIKVKLTGYDIDADVARMRAVYQVVAAAWERRGGRRFFLSADSNEQTENVAVCVAFLEKLRRDHPAAFEALLYLEQPTSRNLLVDEAVADFEDLDLAYELGWSGVALKTCKGHTATLLMIAKTAEAQKVYSVQDLTNPAYAYIHSVGLAARTSPLMGVEANARQFIPAANAEVAKRFPRLFTLRNGEVETHEITPVGLGC